MMGRAAAGLRGRRAARHALVIVAHSQGTVISADLLRFLQAFHDPKLEELGTSLPVHLFTMGSPRCSM